jgi:hypothetical protein
MAKLKEGGDRDLYADRQPRGLEPEVVFVTDRYVPYPYVLVWLAKVT